MNVNRWISIAAIGALGLTTGCASMPNLKVGYYLSKAELSAIVTQTAVCTADNIPIVATDVKWEPAYWQDKDRLYEIDLSKLGSGISKADAALEFYGDGRLKSFNTTQTGQGQSVLQAALKFAVAATAVEATQITSQSEACDALRKFAGEAKALTLIRRGTTHFLDYPLESSRKSFTVDQVSLPSAQFQQVEAIFGQITGYFEKLRDAPIVHDLAKNNRGPTLTLVQPAEVAVTINLTNGDKTERNWTTSMFVPQLGSEYHLPLQKAPWFGENVMEVALDPSGMVTKLRYSGNPDAAGALTVLTDLRGATDGETTTEKAGRLKAEADLILQQHRLVMCRADPSKCTP